MTVAPTPLHHRRMPRRSTLVFVLALGIAVGVLVALLLVRYDVFGSSSSSSSSSASSKGSGVAAARTRDLPAFTGVDLSGSNNVDVVVGGKQSVVVRADENLVDNVTTRVHAGTLVIGNVGSFTTNAPMRVEVHVPSLEALTLSGSGVIAVHGVSAGSLKLSLAGSGVLRASGTVDSLDVRLGGSGDAQLNDLVAREAHAVVAGSGRILVHVTDSLRASMPGTGAIIYTGRPHDVSSSITGTGTITAGR